MVCSFLAMHMANELLSLPVAAATLLTAAGGVAWASRRAAQRLDSSRLPLMGVMGAFVFAAQMINFTLPGMPGTSGHLGGGVLLAILLGPAAGIVTMAGILIIQCLLFQDGGLLALGCNIINMGVVPCLSGWGIYRLITGKAGEVPAWRQYIAAWLACLVGVTAGAALVPVQTLLSGVLRIPFGTFLTVMVGVHLIIAFIEGLITFAVLAYLRQTRPAMIDAEPVATAAGANRRWPVLVSMLVTALLLAGVVSGFASSAPDGLEWTTETYGAVDSSRPPSWAQRVTRWQSQWTPLPDYDKRGEASGERSGTPATGEAEATSGLSGWKSLAGVGGTVVALTTLYGGGWVLCRARKTSSPQAAVK